jgi:SAM-dependent methyltransferase
MTMTMTNQTNQTNQAHHVYPWWLGYFLLSPLRYLTDAPEKLLAPHVSPGMRALDVGSGPGYYSLPLARLVGPEGSVRCVDLQPRMISILTSRAKRAGLLDRVTTSVCAQDSLGLDGLSAEFDFALAVGVVHEVPDRARLLAEIARALKPGAHLLVAEPRHAVSDESFQQTLAEARAAGFDLAERRDSSGRYTVCLAKRDSTAPHAQRPTASRNEGMDTG